MSELTVDKIKLFCRIDNDIEDDLVNTFKQTAEEYLLGAGIEKDYDNFLYNTTVLVLCSYYYENRTTLGAPKSAINAIVQLQLKKDS